MTLPFIAILGGSFDPIHHGHLELAEIITTHIENTEVYFVPCGYPVHRRPSATSVNDRVNMIKLAIACHKHWHLDTYEIDRSGPSYTINTLQHFRQRFPEASIGFIMGMDTFLTLDIAWGTKWRGLLDYAHLLVIPRAEIPLRPSSQLQAFLEQNLIADDKDNNFLHKKANGCIMMLPVAPQSVSSTEIRKKLITRGDVSSLIPKAVYDYIQQQRLYL